jgi:hypothetical protein
LLVNRLLNFLRQTPIVTDKGLCKGDFHISEVFRAFKPSEMF